MKKMKNSELKEYLNMFPDDAPISVILVNQRKRKSYEITGTFCFTELGQPAFCIEVGKAVDMDTEEIAICKEDERHAGDLEGQMVLDFLEIMP